MEKYKKKYLESNIVRPISLRHLSNTQIYAIVDEIDQAYHLGTLQAKADALNIIVEIINGKI